MARFGSLFSGIGGIDLGLECAGWRCAWQVEIDPFCRAALAKHWPDVARFEDVTRLDDLPPVDLMAGGFPCQDVSHAGSKVGIDGRRSGLWGEFARLIARNRPRFVLIENVPGLLQRGIDRVFADLEEAGYAHSEPIRTSAAAVGAPHLRRRIFIVAARLPVSDAIGNALRVEREWLGEQHEEPRAPKSGDDGEEVADRNGERCFSGDPRRSEGSDQRFFFGGAGGPTDDRPGWPPGPDDVHAWRRVQPGAQPAFCSLADGLPSELARWGRDPDGAFLALRAIGNAVVPACVEPIGRRLLREAR